MCRWVSAALLHMCKVFPTLRGKQMIVMSLGDVTIMVLMLRAGRYIRRACTSLGALIWVFDCSTFGSNWLGATDPFLWLLWHLSRSGTITREGGVLYLFNHKCSRLSPVPWVSLLQLFVSNQIAYQPGSAQTQYQSSKNHNLLVPISAHGINCDFGEPTNPSSIPKNSHISKEFSIHLKYTPCPFNVLISCNSAIFWSCKTFIGTVSV